MPFQQPGLVKVQMNKIYRPYQLPKGVWDVRRREHSLHNIPTETVVTEPRMVVPDTSRSWELTLRAVHVRPENSDRSVVQYQSEDYLRKQLAGSGVEMYHLRLPVVTLHEYFDDHGSDGHTSYWFHGYVLTIQEEYEREYKKWVDRGDAHQKTLEWLVSDNQQRQENRKR